MKSGFYIVFLFFVIVAENQRLTKLALINEGCAHAAQATIEMYNSSGLYTTNIVICKRHKQLLVQLYSDR